MFRYQSLKKTSLRKVEVIVRDEKIAINHRWLLEIIQKTNNYSFLCHFNQMVRSGVLPDERAVFWQTQMA